MQDQTITYVEDSRQRHQGTVTIKDEDHTLGNAVRHQLLQNAKVRFAGYRKPHPLEESVEIKVQTNGEVSAPESVIDACGMLTDLLIKLHKSLNSQVQLIKGASAINVYVHRLLWTTRCSERLTL